MSLGEGNVKIHFCYLSWISDFGKLPDDWMTFDEIQREY